MATVEERPIGYGRLKRKEDPRFIRGQGKYVDDVVLPGFGDDPLKVQIAAHPCSMRAPN
jgi:CO/xanthine dehydrogenase Mo-binding subunit